jgi:hypothetical protein
MYAADINQKENSHMNADRLEAAMLAADPLIPAPDDVGCWQPDSTERQELGQPQVFGAN